MTILTRDDENQELEFGLYRQEGGSKKPVSKVVLSYTDEGMISASVTPYEGDAEQTRDIILGAMAKISNDINDEIFKRFSTFKPALFERLREAGYLAEELRADAKFNIQFDLRSGEVLGSHEAITPFGENQDEVNATVFRAASEIFTRIPNDLASSIEEAQRSGGQAAALACMRAAEKEGAAHFPPTEKLYNSILNIEIEGLSREDELYLRRWRVSNAEGVGRQQEAGDEAEVLLNMFGSEVSSRHAAELKLIMAASYFSLGRREAALDLWRGLADNPDELTSEQRGVVWWGISYFHPVDSEKSRVAAKLSADAYIEAGNRDHATRSLIRLADGLLHEEPLKAIESLEAITPLITEQSLGDRNLTAALLHAKANRLAKLGAHREAAELALQAADKRRGLFGAEDEFVSSLMLASIQFDEAGDSATAREIRAEADAFVDAHKPAHFLVARQIEELFNDYDEQKAQQIIADARSQDKADIVAYVLVARAIRSANIADSKRLAMLEEALGVMENARISDYRKQPVLAAIVTQLRNLGSEERAEKWPRRMLDTDPFDLHALSTILDSYKRRQMWGDAANVLERQIKLRGLDPRDGDGIWEVPFQLR